MNDMPDLCADRDPRRLEQRFADSAARWPDRVAVSFGRERLTYAALHERATAIARGLRAHGLAPNAPVGICMRRSPDLIATIIAIYMADCAYVAIDPVNPVERRTHIQRDSGVTVVVADTQFAADGNGWLTIDGLVAERVPDAARDDRLPAEVALAYVLYTSGSTGLPKGTLVSHANVTSLLDACRTLFDFDETDVWTQLHSYGFDFSVWEIWGALAYGGHLVIVGDDDVRDPARLAAILAAEGVTVLNQTPLAFAVLADHLVAAGGPPPDLSLVIFGGAPLDTASVRRWFASVPGGDAAPVLVNMFGITETTVHVTYCPLRSSLLDGVRTSIGRALPNLRVSLRDGYGREVAPGVIGEIFVAGDGVSWGYWNRPRLTAERFLPDPDGCGGRMYRSGDLGVEDADGGMRYVGRADNQVKIRGFRIELGEIDVAVGNLDWVRRAVAVPVDAPDGTQIGVYVVPVEGVALPSLDVVRRALADRLPDYMLPQRVAVVPSLPITTNGKIDRDALSPIGTCTELPRAATVAPQTDTEKRLASIWGEVLGRDSFGIDDDFFALGGDSIRSVTIRARSNAQGMVFTTGDLLAARTVRELARRIDGAGDVAADADADGEVAPFALLPAGARRAFGADVADAYPATQGQLGILYQSDFGEGGSVYHNIELVRLRLPFDAAVLHETWSFLANRHEMLRTGFDLKATPGPLQIVHRHVGPQVEIIDHRNLSPDAQQAALAAFIAREKQRLFDDWGRPPLFRVAAIRVSKDEFRLAFVNHHAIVDGWSVAVLTRDFIDVYRALSAGSEPPLRRTVPYSAFVRAERDAIADPAAKAFWSDQVAGIVPARLPATGDDAPRTIYQQVELDRDTTGGLYDIATRLRLPVKSILLAAHVRSLAVLTGTGDVTTGIVLNGRPEVEGGDATVGLFLNLVPFRAAVAGQGWVALIRDVFEREQAMWPYRRYPLSLMAPGAGGEALFDTLFNYTHFHLLKNDEVGGALTERGGGHERSSVPLVVQAMDHGTGGLTLFLSADASRIGADHLERMAAVYAGALRLLVDDVDGRCDAGELLGASEAARLLAWSGDVVPAGYDGPGLDAALASAFATHSGRVAVSDEAGEIDYAQLDARSAALALALAAAGVRPGDRVGVSLDRSAALIVLLVAVIRAGASYVPLDPDYPDERLQLMVQDAAPVLVVGEGSPPAWATGCDWIELADGTLSRDGQQVVPGTAALPARDGGTPAYVIYTSGSTGRPKGVVVPDRAVERLVRDTNYVEITPDDVLLQLAPVAFDASTFEIWGALLSGARLEVAPPGRVGLDTIAELIVGRAVSVLWLTAPLFHLMVDEEGDALARLRVLLAGGDALSATHVARYLAHPARQGVLVNGYGPTEATTFSCCHVMAEDGDASRPGGVPIGRPIARSSAQVLDALGRRVALGTVGELCVGGMGLAHGYAGDARRTAERFVPDPQVPGGRLYRTGDRVRWLEDGVLAFLGRADRQVKVRGHRVEPGEIEAALQTHPAVGNAAVALREGPAGSARLVAWVAPSGDALPDAAELRRYLDDRLPPYAVPTLFSVLERLPLTANGKVDVRALPDPEAGDAAGGAGAAAQEDSTPQGPVEQTLATIWGEVLGRDSVGRHDNFFELGGDSILSIQIKARAADRGVEFTVRQMAEAQTIARLAVVAATRQPRRAPRYEPFSLLSKRDLASMPDDIVDAYPLSTLQMGMIYHADFDEGSTLYHDVVLYRLDLAFGEDRLHRAIAAVSTRHPVLRAQVDLTEFDQALFLIHAQPSLRPRVIHLESAHDAAIEAWARAEAATVFPDDEWPWFRIFALVEDGGRAFRLAFSFHHLMIDGWSEAALVTEILRNYLALAAGDVPDTTPPPATHASFVAQEMALLADPEAARRWKEKLDGAIQADPVSERLPSPRGDDVSEGVVQQHAAARIDARLADALARTARRLQVPLKSVFLAAQARLMATAGAVSGATIGVAVHNRPESAGGDEVIGMFLNTVPVTIPVDGSGPDALIRSAFEQERALDGLKAYSYARLVELNGDVAPFSMLYNFTQFHVYNTVTAAGVDAARLLTDRTGVAENSFPLALSVQVAADGQIFAAISGRRDCYDAATLSGLAQLFEQALGWLVGDSAAAGATAPVVAAQPVAVADPVEQALATIWADVLSRSRVAPEDNFFEIGGDSISAARITAILRKRLGVPLKISRLYANPTVAKLAASLRDDLLARERPLERTREGER